MDRMNPIARDSRGRSLYRHSAVRLLRIHFQKYRLISLQARARHKSAALCPKPTSELAGASSFALCICFPT
jgi:hypothetical protein